MRGVPGPCPARRLHSAPAGNSDSRRPSRNPTQPALTASRPLPLGSTLTE